MKISGLFKKKDLMQEAEDYKRTGKYDRALEAYGNILELDPTNLKAWYDKASIHLTLEQYFPALDAYEKILGLDPMNVKACYEKGFILLNLVRLDEALEAYDKVLEYEP